MSNVTKTVVVNYEGNPGDQQFYVGQSLNGVGVVIAVGEGDALLTLEKVDDMVRKMEKHVDKLERSIASTIREKLSETSQLEE